jgi:hypothetical protein
MNPSVLMPLPNMASHWKRLKNKTTNPTCRGHLIYYPGCKFHLIFVSMGVSRMGNY